MPSPHLDAWATQPSERYIFDTEQARALCRKQVRANRSHKVLYPDRCALCTFQQEGRLRPGEKINLIKLFEASPAAIGSQTIARALVCAALTLAPLGLAAQNKLALAPTATYDNRYEVYGGVNFENFQAGQNLPKRMNFAGAEAQGTWWLRDKLGATADYRFEGGTTPVLPNNYYNRVAIFQNNFLGGVTYRGPKGRYAAVDYHALAGVSQGIFDQAFNNRQGGSPLTPSQVGLYTNRTKFMSALGGSIDFNYTRNIAVRLQPDLILEHYGTELREFVAVSGGIMYRFGKR